MDIFANFNFYLFTQNSLMDWLIALESRIKNYQQMKHLRVAYQIGVTYETPTTLIEEISVIVEEIVKNHEAVLFDRAHFVNFGASSLDFEIVYHLDNTDYGLFMDTRQAINLDILKTFEQKGIAFAYPTQTIFVEKVSGAAAGCIFFI